MGTTSIRYMELLIVIYQVYVCWATRGFVSGPAVAREQPIK